MNASPNRYCNLPGLILLFLGLPDAASRGCRFDDTADCDADDALDCRFDVCFTLAIVEIMFVEGYGDVW